MNFSLFSHPELLLKDHLKHVLHAGKERFYQNRILGQYADLLEVILAFHDLGKGSKYFQDYLFKNAPRSNLTRHSEFSAIWAFFYCQSELQADILDCLIAYVCIKSHHSDLEDFSEALAPELNTDELLNINAAINYMELNSILEILGLKPCLSANSFRSFLESLNKQTLSSRYRRAKSLITHNHWIYINYLFSLLVWADKHSAIFRHHTVNESSGIWLCEYVDKYKASLPPGTGFISEIRNQAYQELSGNIHESKQGYSLNMPTGSGKTINSLKVALELKKQRPSLQRIIYSLPFTSIIDQNQKVFESILSHNHVEVVSKLILAHHHLADLGYKSDTEYDSNESEYLVETWGSELVVTTFVQLLSSCLSARNRNLKRFHRLANSILILDEVQNIPHHYWHLLRCVLKLVMQHLNSVVILVTATLPMIFEPEEDGIVELAFHKKEWFSGLNRIDIDTRNLGSIFEISDLAELIAADYTTDRKLNRLTILNTVQSSLDLYSLLSTLLPEAELLYLSSNVIPKHRLELIDYIKNNRSSGLIIVSTQVVEAGVDIDVDAVYRDLAPLDSIIQAAGRCNRNSIKTRSRVVLFELVKDNKPYWKYIYDETLIQATIKSLKTETHIISESALHDISVNYYQCLKQATAKDKSKLIINNLSGLNLSSALVYHPKNNPEAFNLIESHPSQTVFVSCDQVACDLLQQFISLQKAFFGDIYQRKSEIKNLTRKMHPYMINVDKRLLKTDEPIFFIERDCLPQYYDLKTGFKRKPDQADYIF